MIEKERLEELIEQGATIYCKDGEIELYSPLKCKVLENFKPKLDCKENDYLIVKYANGADYFLLKDLFETEEGARWELEMTATRTWTETLKLPTWEEFCKMSEKEDDKLFFYKGSTYLLRNDVDKIQILEYYYDNISYIFRKPLTKENYIEACRLCKKLFLNGETNG